MFGLGKKKVIEPVAQKRKFGPTKKLKNTYVITFDTMADETLWQLCKTTPLAVKKIDGEVMDGGSGFVKATEFPNPFAYRMACAYKTLAPVMGKELAGTIVVYGNKNSREDACAILFPTDEVAVFGKDGLNNLNHASRRDLKYQMDKRQKFIDMVNQNQR